MDESQREAYSLAINGHNIIITGQAGSGKTFVIKIIVEYLRKSGHKVAITTSTGIASLQYQDLNALTLHKWSGIGDGRYANGELLHLINTDERFIACKQRILETKVLVIDEISMISSRVLTQVEFLCRKLRDNNFTFGGLGLQVILCGDFYQLPPVPNELCGDFGHFCFEAKWFDNF
ncbi:AAA family ATPase [Solemya elarraichensis gill symbiont]|uniref:DNA helicase Pif1-like DEAD-box helicase domain-containing protein n=1 Tax=Solemya elarraichensis gill symbiont TaxID=1918949 RepID=A0A1T2KSC0_9GAMM|nr:AAA family ATPase [Solemya elarraichensis gill symbiont]OOZ35769.1 hypothetical protein BOW52_11160 [Solemya elarraichensis gill symbiont]